MAKTHRETQFLISSSGTAYAYAHRKNRKKFKGEKKLSLKKYDPVLRKHVVFEESSKLKRVDLKAKKALAKAAAQASSDAAPVAAKPAAAPAKKAKAAKAE